MMSFVISSHLHMLYTPNGIPSIQTKPMGNTDIFTNAMEIMSILNSYIPYQEALRQLYKKKLYICCSNFVFNGILKDSDQITQI